MAPASSLPALEAPRISAEARLGLIEFLLSSLDIERSATFALSWLAANTGIRTAACLVTDPTRHRLEWVADHGIPVPAAGDFSLDLDDESHPLIEAAKRAAATRFSPRTAGLPAAFVDRPLVAVPLRAGSPDAPGTIGDGLLLFATDQLEPSPDVRWFVEIFSQQLFRLQSRHRLAETRFGRERQLLYNTINAVTDPILLTDPEGKLIVANAQAEKLFSVSEEASEGLRRAVQVNNMLFSAALASRGVGASGDDRRELVLVDPVDGSDLLFELLTSPVRESRGGLSIVSVLRNVTDLGRARQEIDESYRRLRFAQAEVRDERRRVELLIDSVADPILVTDPAGDIVLTNTRAAQLFTTEASRTESAQRRIRTNGARFSTFLSNLLSSPTETRWRGEFELLDPDAGTAIPVEAIAGTILSEQGELTWVVTILHDRSEAVERSRLYAQLQQASSELEGRVQEATAELAQQNELRRRQAIALEQASALKTQFLANVSHEVRTPLNAILGYTQMLLQEISGPVTLAQRRHLDRVDSNARHLLTLINDILDISRIESGRMPVNLGLFKIPELVDEVVTELEPIIKRSRLAFSVEIEQGLPSIRSDRQKVKQILVNLLSNAVKFTPEGSVRIQARQDTAERSICIAVCDTGVGIARQDQDRIFESFQQLDTAPTRTWGGTGLGLAICRRLAEMLGGRIELHSSPGQGSTFTLHLPLRGGGGKGTGR